MNKCHFLGRLVRDPDLRTTKGDKQVVNFTIAISRSFKRGDQRAQETAYLDCEAWDTGATAIAKHAKKGKPIIVHGALKQDNWEDDSGSKRSKLKLRVESFDFVPFNPRDDEQDAQSDSTPAAATNDVDNSANNGNVDEIPF